MLCASDFRQMARNALRGKWTVAVIAGLLAMLLGAASTSGGIEFEFNIGGADSAAETQILDGLTSEVAAGQVGDQLIGWLIGLGIGIVVIAFAIAAVFVVVGSIVKVGYVKFNLDLIDQQKDPELRTLAAYFSYWKPAVASSLLIALSICVGTLFFIIPGILAIYSYAMTSYVLAENPEMTAREAMARSKEIMHGNRFRLFCLEISFFGWAILCTLTAGIGNLWLVPYQQAATAAFYREVSGTKYLASADTTTTYL